MVLMMFIGFQAGAIESPDFGCVADNLKASNSDIYYGLSNFDITTMLPITEMAGRTDSVRSRQKSIRC